MSLSVIILAAGKGTRMKSALPKVLQPLASRPLLGHVLDTAEKLSASEIITIFGHGGQLVKDRFADKNIRWVEQSEQLGTGHAVQMSLPVLKADGKSLILSGDVPLVSVATLQRLLDATDDLGMITLTVDDPTGYGRIVRDDSGNITAIVEHKDATDEQKRINEINTGIYCVSNAKLHQWLPKLDNNNAQGEYYLTDIVAMALADGLGIASVAPQYAFEVDGVNDRSQLARLERQWQAYQAQDLMKQGVHLLDPSRFDLRGSLTVGQDVEIDINVIITGDCTIGNNVKIGAGCVISDSTIADNTIIAPYSVLENAVVGDNNRIGPFARLRPQAVTASDVHIGNFVELKNTQMATGSKANHLAYLGDSTVGEETNIGAGTITANYDGVNKYRTTIGKQVRVGSNSVLVAPVTLGDKATVGAGSVITKDCPPDTLVVARGKQVAINGWVRPEKPKS